MELPDSPLQPAAALASDGIMAMLKSATAELHRQVESRPLQRAMARGSVTRGQCSAYLAQLWLIHSALEGCLRDCCRDHAAIARVYQAHQNRAHLLRDDLGVFGVSTGAIQPTPAAASLIEQIDAVGRGGAIGLLGMLYVLEGSTNGARFIAPRVNDALGLPRGALRSFDPYGDQQPERWAAFKNDMNDLELDEAQTEAILAAAAAMFRAIADFSDEVMAIPSHD